MSCLSASLYISCLWWFPLVSHPVIHCFLLIGSSISALAFCFFLQGFSWYILILGIIYLGGTYILFIFVSISYPNYENSGSLSLWGFFAVWSVVFYFLWCCDPIPDLVIDCGDVVNSFSELGTYCLLGLILLLGFSIISLVSSDKSSFYR